MTPGGQSGEDSAAALIRVERNGALPVKAAILPLILHSLFLSNWGLAGEHGAMLETLRTFLILYVPLSLSGWILLGAGSPMLARGAGIGLAVLDLLLLSALVLATGGFGSLLYWAYLLMIARHALSFPVDGMQLALDALAAILYLLAGIFHIRIEELDNPGEALAFEPFVLKIAVLALVSASGFGIQTLIVREREAREHRRERAVRQQQLQMAGRLAGEIAHQLKNPLGIINNAAYNLQKAREGGQPLDPHIRIIREEIGRSDRILTDLLDYARLKEGRIESLDPAAEAEEAIARVFPPGTGFRVGIRRDYRRPLPRLLMQREHLSEILVNLLHNARQAMEGEGSLEVGLRFEGPCTVVATVADDGPGIDPGRLPEIFDPYFTTKETGTGLGLAIVKHSAELYGGTVEAESEPGRGTRFSVRLPARTQLKLSP